METMRVTPGLKRADVVHDYVVHLVFSDGLEADVDLSYVLELGPVFEILRDPVEFRQVRVSSAANTVTWPNGAVSRRNRSTNWRRRRPQSPRSRRSMDLRSRAPGRRR